MTILHISHVRLVRALLGEDAISAKKCASGNPLPILGISVRVDMGGITFIPEPEKLVAWKKTISDALASKFLPGGEASKLAGMLHSIVYLIHGAFDI